MTDWPAPDPAKPYFLAEYGRDHGEPTLMRRNEGELVIMCRSGDPDYAGDAKSVLVVPRFHHVKRADAWKADDPDQVAFAIKVMGMLNAEMAAPTDTPDDGSGAVETLPEVTANIRDHLRYLKDSRNMSLVRIWVEEECVKLDTLSSPDPAVTRLIEAAREALDLLILLDEATDDMLPIPGADFDTTIDHLRDAYRAAVQDAQGGRSKSRA